MYWIKSDEEYERELWKYKRGLAWADDTRRSLEDKGWSEEEVAGLYGQEGAK